MEGDGGFGMWLGAERSAAVQRLAKNPENAGLRVVVETLDSVYDVYRLATGQSLMELESYLRLRQTAGLPAPDGGWPEFWPEGWAEVDMENMANSLLSLIKRRNQEVSLGAN